MNQKRLDELTEAYHAMCDFLPVAALDELCQLQIGELISAKILRGGFDDGTQPPGRTFRPPDDPSRVR